MTGRGGVLPRSAGWLAGQEAGRMASRDRLDNTTTQAETVTAYAICAA